MAGSIKVAEPGSFRQLGDRIVYVHGSGDETCPLAGVLIGDFSDPRRTLYISGRCGSIRDGSHSTSLALELLDGSIHFSESSSDRYRKIHFVQLQTEIDLAGYIDRGQRARDLTFRGLLEVDARYRRGESPAIRDQAGQRSVRVQIHRRMAFPFASVLLTFLSVPLGIRPLRSGRSAGALTAIALMGLYWLVFSAGEMAGERGWLPIWLGIWSANVLVLVLALVLMRRAVRGDS
jgi:lipopolysaccharide export LptBFGC system permease protein LptF